jgi:hypothetical protein
MKRPCAARTKAGRPCPIHAGPRGLCHVHDPDAKYAQQHPSTRLALLRRPDVQLALTSDASRTGLEPKPLTPRAQELLFEILAPYG